MRLTRQKTKNTGKRATNKQEVANVNRTALFIGGIAAVVILVVMIYSFYM